MKLPSLQTLWHETNRVSMRFPLQFLLAITSTAVWWWVCDLDYKERQLSNELVTTLAIFNITLTLLLALDLFCESHGYSHIKKWILRLVALAVCTLLYFILDPWFYEADFFRICLLAFAFHLLVAFAPFVGKPDLNGFWQYNKTLFLRFLAAAFYAAVLYAGIAIAIGAIDNLFNVSIDSSWYMKLFAVVSAGFVTVFFLAGIPTDFVALEKSDSYPKGLKVFTQFVLIPLMTIYLAILLLYEVKIIVEWTLPKGLVSILILGYAVFGILSLLLVYPIKAKEENGWIKLFSKFFYVTMIPLIILLLLAIGKRIGNYGITESRYILIVLAAWLAGITIYFLTSKKQNIKIIPISLFILALLATYGPQSAFSISKNAQVARLHRLMASKNNKDVRQQSEVVDYLVERHGLRALQAFTKSDLGVIESEMDKKIKLKNESTFTRDRLKRDTAYKLLNVKYTPVDFDYAQLEFTNSNNGVISVSGYDVLFPFDEYRDTIRYDNITFKLKQNPEMLGTKNNNKLTVTVGAEPPFDFNIKKLALDSYRRYAADGAVNFETYQVPDSTMQFFHHTKKYAFKLVVSKMNGNYDKVKNDYEWFDFSGYLLIRKIN